MDAFAGEDLGIPDALLGEDWLNGFHDFPDDAVASSLSLFGSRDDGPLEGLFHERTSAPTPQPMRGSFSMNDLTLLQHQPPPQWCPQHKLVSMKPKLQSVPEGTPSNGGPLNLMPLPGSSHALSAAQAPLQPGPQPDTPNSLPVGPGNEAMHVCMAGPRHNSDDGGYVDLDSDGPCYMTSQLPSTGNLTRQLQLTHVKSEQQLHQGAQQQQASTYQSQRPVDDLFTSSSLVPFGLGMGSTAAGPGQQAYPQQQQKSGQRSHHYHTSMPAGCTEFGQPVSATCAAGAAQAVVAASGGPLRKSQSAVELGSWRSFAAAAGMGMEEAWEMDMSEDSVKPWKLTPEERLARIQKHREKRTLRNFNRAVKYQCRKSVADTRPRVRGRFARLEEPCGGLQQEACRRRDRCPGSGSLENSLVTEGPSSSDPQTSSGGAGGGAGPSSHANAVQQGNQAMSVFRPAAATPSGLTQGGLSACMSPDGLLSHSPMANMGSQGQSAGPGGLHSMFMLGGASATAGVMSHHAPCAFLHPGRPSSMEAPAPGACDQQGGMSIPMHAHAGMDAVHGMHGVQLLGYGSAPTTFCPLMAPPTLSPPSSGSIFTGNCTVQGSASKAPHGGQTHLLQHSMLTYSSLQHQLPPLPYVPSGQTIFTGASALGCFSQGRADLGMQQLTATSASAHPSLSPVRAPGSPTLSAGSHSVGLGLSLVDFSAAHSPSFGM